MLNRHVPDSNLLPRNETKLVCRRGGRIMRYSVSWAATRYATIPNLFNRRSTWINYVRLYYFLRYVETLGEYIRVMDDANRGLFIVAGD